MRGPTDSSAGFLLLFFLVFPVNLKLSFFNPATKPRQVLPAVALFAVSLTYKEALFEVRERFLHRHDFQPSGEKWAMA